MNKPELLAPAGNLEKLKIAYLYGADACYVGGKKFSLRARASNFSYEDIIEGVKFAHSLNKKLYITMNIVPHEDDFDGLIDYLKFLEDNEIDGIIVSSMYIATTALKYAPKLEVHLSTQASCVNSESVKFYEKLGLKRVVLGREVPISLIKEIIKKINIETEVFIHGGMCTSFSGRCMLSNHMTNRDANRGGCAHSCRWNYDLFDEENKKINSDTYLNIGSKDLMAVRHIKDLIECGVKSLKIEGRMKSLYYIACVVRCYRNIIDDYFDGKEIDYEFYEKEIQKAENRLTSTGFLKGMVTKEEQLYNVRAEIPTKDFLGIVKEYNSETGECIIEQRNYFEPHDTLEFFGPDLKNTVFKVEEIYDLDGNLLDAARHPLQLIKFKVPFKVSLHDMLRKA